jgi:hypothetical protein
MPWRSDARSANAPIQGFQAILAFRNGARKMTSQNQSLFTRTLKAWARQWEEEHHPKEEKKVSEFRRMVNLATWDLYYGPIGDGSFGDPTVDIDGNENEWSGYPGFTSALDKIKVGLESVPSQLWIDNIAEDWQETEPQATLCDVCADDTDDSECDFCVDGMVEPFWEDYTVVDRKDLLEAILGKELPAYL